MDVIRERVPIETPAADVMSAAVAEVSVKVPENTRVARVLCCPTRLMNLSAEAVSGAVAFTGTVEFGVIYTDESGGWPCDGPESFRHSLAAPAALPGMLADTRAPWRRPASISTVA
jgi:hypothetical protein